MVPVGDGVMGPVVDIKEAAAMAMVWDGGAGGGRGRTGSTHYGPPKQPAESHTMRL